MFGFGTKLQKMNIFKNINQISSTVTTRTCFVNRMNQNVAKCWYPNEKTVVVPVCLNGKCCFSGYVGIVLTKSPPIAPYRRHVVNAIFLKYSKGGRLSSSHLGIQNIPSDVCYEDTKHYQVQSEHRRIQNSFKHLRETVFG